MTKTVDQPLLRKSSFELLAESSIDRVEYTAETIVERTFKAGDRKKEDGPKRQKKVTRTRI